MRQKIAKACALSRPWCGPCCWEHALSHVGVDVVDLRRLLAERSGRDLRVVILGNSVARAHDFGAARVLVNALQYAIGPERQVRLDFANVHGGFQMAQVWRCGMKQLDVADIVIFQYAVMPRNRIVEGIVRSALQLPNKPLLLYISHCYMADFPNDPDWLSSPLHSKLRSFDAHRFRADELRLARHYDITMVSTCAAYETMLHHNCNDVQRSVDRLSGLQEMFFGAADPVHQSALGSSMQGCLASQALLKGEPSKKGNATLPARLWEENEARQAEFCPPAGLLKSASAGSGWTLAQGGRGGKKEWIGSNEVGAFIDLQMHEPAGHFFVLAYVHHALPMGRVEVQVVGHSSTVIDACCPSTGCGHGVPQGQGTYRAFRVPASGNLPMQVHTVRITNIARFPNGNSNCSRGGAKFDIAELDGVA
mmetsp:Transcript_149329/g.478405  ORF Transcript_149329/g.478405 Transcript_149329/m.478405 type:complete len:422 (-) Transcript_149329:125-1390(-)